MANHSHHSFSDAGENYVSRAAYKLASVVSAFGLEFNGKVVLDVGSSTGGFTDYAIKNGAKKVIAVDKGTGQMDPTLRFNERIELHEKTAIRDFSTNQQLDIVLIDVSFTSLINVLPYVANLVNKHTVIVAMAKPQFEAANDSLKNNGVIKNEKIRRRVLADLEGWMKQYFVIQAKADSKIEGLKGNKERFYKLACSNRIIA